MTAILVTYDDDDDAPASIGRLIAEGIDVRRVDSEAAIENVCAAEAGALTNREAESLGMAK